MKKNSHPANTVKAVSSEELKIIQRRKKNPVRESRRQKELTRMLLTVPAHKTRTPTPEVNHNVMVS